MCVLAFVLFTSSAGMQLPQLRPKTRRFCRVAFSRLLKLLFLGLRWWVRISARGSIAWSCLPETECSVSGAMSRAAVGEVEARHGGVRSEGIILCSLIPSTCSQDLFNNFAKSRADFESLGVDAFKK